MKEIKPKSSAVVDIGQTARQSLVKELTDYMYSRVEDIRLTEETMQNAINSILSKYDVDFSNLTSIITDITDELVGKSVKVHYKIHEEMDKQIFEGVVERILYRDTYYGLSTINSILEHPNITEEQCTCMKLAMYEETRPKIYHRIVLNTQNQGILIIPLIRGVYIEQE